MYKLMLADDEAVIRRNIQRLIEWGEYGFEMIACCENGHELLEEVEKEVPDLIITDISMPYIDGIEVARQVSNQYPWVKIIFLTGHNEFEYAKEAIDLHVQKYILKPVTASDMQEMLKEMKTCLDEEMKNKSLMSDLEAFYESHKAILREMFLEQLLTSAEGSEQFEEKVKTLRLDYLKGSRFQVGALAFELGETSEWRKSEDLIKFSACNIIQEILWERQMGYYVVGQGCIHILLSNAKYEEVDEEEIFFQTLEEIQGCIEKYLKCIVTIGIGRVSEYLSAIHLSAEESLVALGYRSSIGNSRLIYINDIEPHRSRSDLFDCNDEKKLLAVIKSGDSEDVDTVYHKMMETLLEEKLPIEQMRIYILTVELNLIREVSHMGLDYVELMSLNQMKELFEAWDYDKIGQLFHHFCMNLVKYITENRKNRYSGLVDKTIEIIKRDYGNSDLSIDSVCQELHLSPSYLRSIFKKETQKTFGNYLTEVRMESAKYLLETSKKKNYEVGMSVGYEDPHYFSYCFKKYFKMTPNEVRYK